MQILSCHFFRCKFVSFWMLTSLGLKTYSISNYYCPMSSQKLNDACIKWVVFRVIIALKRRVFFKKWGSIPGPPAACPKINISQVIQCDLFIPQLEVTNDLWKGHLTIPQKGHQQNCQVPINRNHFKKWNFPSSKHRFWGASSWIYLDLRRGRHAIII